MADDFTPTGQRQISVRDAYLTRVLPQWTTPNWTDANLWRRAVRLQPICIAARDTLISYLLGTDYQIEARDSDDTSKYLKDVEYYTDLFQHLDGLDFEVHLDLLCQDILDTPFGGASEIGREGDRPDGKTLWVQHMDSATLFPTLNPEWPVGQRVPGAQVNAIYFPKHAVNRAYLSPRPEFDKKGWGMAPPEKVYLALELLYRGDRYYANLLIDTPEAGVLDLLDMSKDSAMEWLESFKMLFTGADSFKVPVLYEHTEPARWIPFGRPPTDLIFDAVTFKYAQIVCAGYGIKIEDLGLAKSEGRTLAGAIRTERQTRRTGFAVLKHKTRAYFENMLPKHLKFTWLDMDDEAMIARGRARLANAQALGELRNSSLIKLEEGRRQLAADGLLSIQIDPDDLTGLEPTGGNLTTRPFAFNRPNVPPSAGGRGEVKPLQKTLSEAVTSAMDKATDSRIRRLSKVMIRESYADFANIAGELDESDLGDWLEGVVMLVFEDDSAQDVDDVVKRAFEARRGALDIYLNDEKWWSIAPFLDNEKIRATMLTSFEDGQRDALAFMAISFYEEGLRKSSEFGGKPHIDDLKSREAIDDGSRSIIAQIDSETIDKIKKVVASAVYESFASTSVAASIRRGIPIDELLEDNEYINLVTRIAQGGLGELTSARVESYGSDFEDLVWETGVLSVFRHTGIPQEEIDALKLDGKNREIKLSPHKLVTILNRSLPEILKED
jgi:hypothetical protein